MTINREKALLIPLGHAGCLPPTNRAAEPLTPVPPYVKSVKIDPRTLEPIDEEGPAAEEPGASSSPE